MGTKTVNLIVMDNGQYYLSTSAGTVHLQVGKVKVHIMPYDTQATVAEVTSTLKKGDVHLCHNNANLLKVQMIEDVTFFDAPLHIKDIQNRIDDLKRKQSAIETKFKYNWHFIHLADIKVSSELLDDCTKLHVLCKITNPANNYGTRRLRIGLYSNYIRTLDQIVEKHPYYFTSAKKIVIK